MCECGWCSECEIAKNYEDYALSNDYEDGKEKMLKEIRMRESKQVIMNIIGVPRKFIYKDYKSDKSN